MRGYKGRGVAVAIADNQQIQDIRLMMPQTGSISGRVLDSDGEPMGHARVQAMEAFYQDGQNRLYTLNVVQTNDLGEFSLFWLPPGEYFVAAVPEDPLRQNVAFSVAPPGIGGHRSDALPPIVTRRNLADGGFTEDVYRPVYYGAKNSGTFTKLFGDLVNVPDLVSILPVVFLSADIAVGAFEFPLKAFALSGVDSISSRHSLVYTNSCLLCFESAGFDARQFAAAHPLTDANLFAMLLPVNCLGRRSDR
jgi:hypothetical protein